MKKLLSIVLATGIAGASVFTPYTNAEAASVSKAEALVKAAEQHAGALKWQISVELTKEIKYPDMKIFNLTKDAYLNAKKEIANISAKDKAKLEKRLEDNAGIHYTRAMGYIDAITSGKKIVDKANQLNKLYAANPTSDVTEKSYHELSSEIRKQAILLYRVYGKSTRDAILTKYKTPGEKALESSKYVITAKMELDKLDDLISKKADQKTVEAQVSIFLDSLDAIEDDAIISDLYSAYYDSIREDENFVAQEKEINEFFEKATEYANEEKLEETLSLYSKDFPGYASLKENLETTFKDYNVRYQTLGLEVQYIIDNTAAVVHDQKSIFNTTDSLEHTTIYLLEKDKDGNWKFLDSSDIIEETSDSTDEDNTELPVESDSQENSDVQTVE
ncbi:hypothetical protein [Psychrobacillus lasiicapitis]|uniref:SbsC C-terminal domain-containing protein n=1 Tax=Psychrobacillus lasiicapitis TaxID=1636719 RepID=A0A544SX90_9BACI|nr:hypothetical protein [Psychrobacillus lasiicapitis]TQR09757.1 hypothetical protein FG382_18610 [Psychrobacillus lasiicapitis]GGA23245.1 hypothetical protein GCM10011384_11090 [Psychrobacillus lasiicapitis]